MSSEELILDENLDGQPLTADPLNLASVGQRFVNNLIDAIVVWLLIVGYMMSVMFVLGIFENPDPETFTSGPYITMMMFMYAVPPIYYICMEYFFGRTLGKYVSGCKVVDYQGNKPTFLNAFLRTLIRVIPFEFVSVFFASRRMWHDQWTNTYVIKAR